MKKKIGLVLAMLAVVCMAGIFAETTFNLDNYKGTKRIWKNSDGETNIIWCYKLPQKDIDAIWNNLPDVFIAYGTKWYPYEPDYDYVYSYVPTLRNLMYEYNLLCTEILQNENGRKYIWTYVMNNEFYDDFYGKTREVMRF